MAFPALKKAVFGALDLATGAGVQRAINTLQGNVEAVLGPMSRASQNDSVIVTGVSLITGQNNVVDHRLGRTLSGWKLVRVRGQATIWDTQDANKSPSLSLWLSTSANVSVDLEVF